MNIVTVSAAFHALAVGSMAGLMVGMITRTALGHTGRPLAAGLPEIVMYGLILSAAIARTAAALVPPALYQSLLIFSMLCWSATFAVYLAVYGPYLVNARIDGLEG
jgi:uncharacterized protein involved in response to NO